jgi:hypothetical protein
MRFRRCLVAVIAMLPVLACSQKMPAGIFYYKTARATCESLAADDSGVLSSCGFCNAGGRFERTRSGAMALVCKDHDGTTETIVYDVALEPGVVRLSSGGKRGPDLFATEADCQRAITSEDRGAVKKAEAEAAERARKAEAAAEEQRRDEERRRAAEVARARRARAKGCCECLSKGRSGPYACLRADVDVAGCVQRLAAGNRSMTEPYCFGFPCGSVCREFR